MLRRAREVMFQLDAVGVCHSDRPAPRHDRAAAGAVLGHDIGRHTSSRSARVSRLRRLAITARRLQLEVYMCVPLPVLQPRRPCCANHRARRCVTMLDGTAAAPATGWGPARPSTWFLSGVGVMARIRRPHDRNLFSTTPMSRPTRRGACRLRLHHRGAPRSTPTARVRARPPAVCGATGGVGLTSSREGCAIAVGQRIIAIGHSDAKLYFAKCFGAPTIIKAAPGEDHQQLKKPDLRRPRLRIRMRSARARSRPRLQCESAAAACPSSRRRSTGEGHHARNRHRSLPFEKKPSPSATSARRGAARRLPQELSRYNRRQAQLSDADRARR